MILTKLIRYNSEYFQPFIEILSVWFWAFVIDLNLLYTVPVMSDILYFTTRMMQNWRYIVQYNSKGQ